jgi:hypothetical protein
MAKTEQWNEQEHPAIKKEATGRVGRGSRRADQSFPTA